MTLNIKRSGLLLLAAGVLGGTACSNRADPVDSTLKADLDAAGGSGIELAPAAARSQVVVSAIEGGAKAAPAPSANKPVPKPSPRPITHVATKQAPQQEVIEA